MTVPFPKRFTLQRFLNTRARFALVFASGLFFALFSGGALAQWSVQISSDEMTGEAIAAAGSGWVSPRRQMPFPNGDVRAVLGFACKGSYETAYVKFTNSPNIVNTDTHDGYDTMRKRVRWDTETDTTHFRQRWGDTSLEFTRTSQALEKIKSSNSMLLELDWYGSGNVYFEFPLDGARQAIAKGRETCRQPQ